MTDTTTQAEPRPLSLVERASRVCQRMGGISKAEADVYVADLLHHELRGFARLDQAGTGHEFQQLRDHVADRKRLEELAYAESEAEARAAQPADTGDVAEPEHEPAAE